MLAYVIDGASYDKLLFIISENHHAELRDFIIEDMDRSGTYIKGKGMYTDQDREMIFVVVSRKEVHLVQNKVRIPKPSWSSPTPTRRSAKASSSSPTRTPSRRWDNPTINN